MNLRLFTITLAFPVCLHAGEPDGARHRVEQESLAILKKAFPYQTAASPENVEKKEPTSDVVKMTPFVVVDSPLQHELRKKIQNESEQKKTDRFSAAKGGLFYKNERFDLGASRYRDLFKEDANYKDKTPAVKIDLLHFRF